MKRICKQCGVEFTLTQDEIAFYQRKNLHIPKRCEKCRLENRAPKTDQVVRAYDAGRNDKKRAWIAVAAVLLLLAVGVVGFRSTLLLKQNAAITDLQPVQEAAADVRTVADIEVDAGRQEIVDEPIEEIAAEQPPAIEVEQTPIFAYHFRKAQYLQEHFEKHGAELGYTTAEEYLAGANRLIASSEALHKLEAEDGDDVFYLESTNEIVFVSKDGYLRTYFKPKDGKAYFDKQ